MTDEQILASITAGYICAEMEKLGKPEAIKCARRKGTNIDWAIVEELRREARAAGVPENLLHLPPALETYLRTPKIMAKLHHMQNSYIQAQTS